MTTYIFNQAGSIPGIPGTFAGCRVDVDEEGNIIETPLAQHPAFEAAIDAVMSEDPGKTDPELPAISAPVAVAQETVVQEQVTPPAEPVPYLNGG